MGSPPCKAACMVHAGGLSGSGLRLPHGATIGKLAHLLSLSHASPNVQSPVTLAPQGMLARPDWQPLAAIPFAQIPCGSGNALAASMGMWTWDTAVHAIVKGQQRALDVATGAGGASAGSPARMLQMPPHQCQLDPRRTRGLPRLRFEQAKPRQAGCHSACLLCSAAGVAAAALLLLPQHQLWPGALVLCGMLLLVGQVRQAGMSYWLPDASELLLCPPRGW